MRKVYNTLLAHLTIIIIFSTLYYVIGEDKYKFFSDTDREASYLTYLNLATTIQAGVGVSSVLPNSASSQILVITQQLIQIGLQAILYIFLGEHMYKYFIIDKLISKHNI